MMPDDLDSPEVQILKILLQDNNTIQKELVEIKTMIEKFTTEKTQYWKDRATAQRNRCW